MKDRARKGQAMLIATLALGGAILGATTIAGLLMLYQIRATTDAEHSAQAIFAADAGIEWTLFDFFCTQTTPPRCSIPPDPPLPGNPAGTLSDGATIQTTCYDSTGVNIVPCSSTSTAASAVSKGLSIDTQRAFFLNL